MCIMIIDAHQHFWHYTDREFGWISNGAIRRDFLPADLAREIKAAGVDGTIAVEARQSVEETRWLLDLAAENPFIKGVTGWLDLRNPAALHAALGALDSAKLCAVRHVVQDEPDDAFILRDDFNAGVTTVGEQGLVYEILVFRRQLANAIVFADRHPNMRLVLDHMGKPERSPGTPNDAWVRLIREMGKREHVWCKVSGLVTEVGNVDFRPYIETVLEAFGPNRVFWGSDWPVVTADLAYADWLAACRGILPESCFATVAQDFYQL